MHKRINNQNLSFSPIPLEKKNFDWLILLCTMHYALYKSLCCGHSLPSLFFSLTSWMMDIKDNINKETKTVFVSEIEVKSMMNDNLELDYAEMLRYIGLVVSDGKRPKFLRLHLCYVHYISVESSTKILANKFHVCLSFRSRLLKFGNDRRCTDTKIIYQ